MAKIKSQDELLYCQRCGISFLWTSEEQPPIDADSTATTPHYCPGCRRLLPVDQRERGAVKWFNGRKRYGFILRHNGEEIFAPQSEVTDHARLQPGDLVEFAIQQNERGIFASAIHLLVSATTPA